MYTQTETSIPQKKGVRAKMATGKVKWFDNRRGFGFIIRKGRKDAFVHHTSILGTGYKTLEEGEQVSYELVMAENGPRALNVKRERR